MLTARQAELLTYIADGIRTQGRSPTYEQLTSSMRIRSRSGIHRLVTELEERGYLKRQGRRRHGMKILRMPQGVVSKPFSVAPAGLADVPLRGHISTVAPMPLAPGILGTIHVPEGMVDDGFHYAARAAGDGIPGIHEGDVCVLRAQGYGLVGDLVVVTDGNGSMLLPYREGLKAVTARLAGVLRSY